MNRRHFLALPFLALAAKPKAATVESQCSRFRRPDRSLLVLHVQLGDRVLWSHEPSQTGVRWEISWPKGRPFGLKDLPMVYNL